jgi:hypothetical protein
MHTVPSRHLRRRDALPIELALVQGVPTRQQSPWRHPSPRRVCCVLHNGRLPFVLQRRHCERIPAQHTGAMRRVVVRWIVQLSAIGDPPVRVHHRSHCLCVVRTRGLCRQETNDSFTASSWTHRGTATRSRGQQKPNTQQQRQPRQPRPRSRPSRVTEHDTDIQIRRVHSYAVVRIRIQSSH